MTAKKRKIIRIASSVASDGAHVLYALCDDGTLWLKTPNADYPPMRAWRIVEDIPQGRP